MAQQGANQVLTKANKTAPVRLGTSLAGACFTALVAMATGGWAVEKGEIGQRSEAKVQQSETDLAAAQIKVLSQALASRGAAYSEQGDLAGAIADYDRAIEIDPQNTGAYGNRGNARRAQSDLDGALRDLNRAIELGLDSAIPLRDQVLRLLAQ